MITALSAEFTTYAMDRRGRGASADYEEYSIELEFDDVAAVIDGIGGGVDVLGHSYGAVCALEATLRTPRVRRLVLYEPPLPVGVEIYPPGLIERLDQLRASGDRDGVVATFYREVVRMPRPSWTSCVPIRAGRHGLRRAHTIARELRIADADDPDFERFATVRVPTLLLLGGDSPPFLVDPTRRLHECIPSRS